MTEILEDRLPGTTILNKFDGPYNGARFLESFVETRGYLTPLRAQHDDSKGRHKDEFQYEYEEKFWNDARAGKLIESATISLRKFKILEWIPQSPGLYHTPEAKERRREALDHRVDNELRIFDPYGKARMIDGGIGCLRLLVKPIAGERLKFLTATSSGSAHAGIVLAVRERTNQKLLSKIKNDGAALCKNLSGQIRFLPRDLLLFPSRRGIPRVYVFANDVKPDDSYSPQPDELDVTPTVTFEGEVKGEQGTFLTYSHFDPSKPEGLSSCVNWLEDNYVKSRFHGRVLTDFDEEIPHFPDTVLPVRDLMAKTILQTKVVSDLCDNYGLNINDKQVIINIVEKMNMNIVKAGRDIIRTNIQQNSPDASQD